MPYIPPHIEKLKPYQSARDLYQGDYLFLDANENCFGSLVGIEDLLDESGISNVKLGNYPDTDSTRLRRALSKYYEINEDEIAIFNGSDESIPDIITAFSDYKDGIAGMDVGFCMYHAFCAIHNRNYIELKTDESFNLMVKKDDKKELEEKLKKTRICFLDTPNNPSGNSQSRETMEFLIELTRKTNTLLVIDEAYNAFEDNPKKSSFIKSAPQLPHVLVMRSFSKSWGLAGGRLGVIVGNKELIKNLIKVRIPYHVSVISEELGVVAVGRRKEMERRCELIKQYRYELANDLKKIKLSTEKGVEARTLQVYPSQTNFLLVRFPKNSREIFDRLINEYKIVLRYFGEIDRLANCVRITVGLPEQNKRLIKALKKTCI